MVDAVEILLKRNLELKFGEKRVHFPLTRLGESLHYGHVSRKLPIRSLVPWGGSMAIRLLAANLPGYGAEVSAPSYFRIAVPSFRSFGVHPAPEPEPEAILSREELQSLFQGELGPRVRKRGVLTEREEQQKHQARRIRHALYPARVPRAIGGH